VTEHPITVPPTIDLTAAIPRIEACCTDAGLRITQRGSLAKYRGCTHWHFKRPNHTGTLELTVWPDQKSAWFITRSNREAEWMPSMIGELIPIIEAEFSRAS
jgi:hypothetical protein